MKPCIVLVGAQHVGKTALGKGLAEKLGVPFYDTDQMVTKTYGKHITVFAYEKGLKDGYNWAETEVSKVLVKKFLGSEPISAVISTGSGFYQDDTALEELSKIGTIYWLDGDINLGAQRIVEEATTDPAKKNPVLMTYGKFYNLYSYAVEDKVETFEDIRQSYLKLTIPTLKDFARIAEVTVKPKDASVEENVQLLYDSIVWDSENLKIRPAV
ncbi:MAG: hypothetical protein J6N81_10760 [Treponema sp.]|uniref:shikimate kinase n=1 Tax=Treponema sp. TaxID=166 RepID=UPI001B2546AD|nr:shikimate kinase [Treponema sp.]MBO6220028.1 hypothetical protein [Treponema sp.]MBQ8679719.1 hypothetical protein [Treponema sp.]